MLRLVGSENTGKYGKDFGQTVGVLHHLSDHGVGVDYSGQYCSLGCVVGSVEGRPGLLYRDLPPEQPQGWPKTPGLPRDCGPQLPLGAGFDLRVGGLASCGQVSDVGITWPTVELVYLDFLPPPGLHVVPDLRDSVAKPYLQDLLVALHSRDCALGVAKQGDPVGHLAEPWQDRGDEPGK